MKYNKLAKKSVRPDVEVKNCLSIKTQICDN